MKTKYTISPSENFGITYQSTKQLTKAKTELGFDNPTDWREASKSEYDNWVLALRFEDGVWTQ